MYVFIVSHPLLTFFAKSKAFPEITVSVTVNRMCCIIPILLAVIPMKFLVFAVIIIPPKFMFQQVGMAPLKNYWKLSPGLS